MYKTPKKAKCYRLTDQPTKQVKESHARDQKEKLEIDNLSDSEKKGLKSLKKRVREGELVITTTDKSGRMAVLSREQYIEAGEEHTSKDMQRTDFRLAI